MTVVDWILCLMCPLIALIVSRSRDGARAEKMRKIAIAPGVTRAMERWVPITLIVLLVGNWVIKLFQ